MASRAQSNKIIQDLDDCVNDLKIFFQEKNVPIDDDNVTLHRFEEKIEFLLLLGLKDKPGLLGVKKSYWDYICACFSSSKRVHEGIKFVKSLSELKTSLGRGRALIRFCLMQKCLADTLQTCFMTEKLTREYYSERSFTIQKKFWSAILTSLYDLNDIKFDLIAHNIELDVSWPSFARKHFLSMENNVSHSKNFSSPSLYSFSSQNDDMLFDDTDALSFQGDSDADISMVKLEVSKLSEANEELSKQNKSLLNRINFLVEEKTQLEIRFQNLQNKYLPLLPLKHSNENCKGISHVLLSVTKSESPSYSESSSSFVNENCVTKFNNNDFEIKKNPKVASNFKSYDDSFLLKNFSQNTLLKRSFSDYCLFGTEHSKKIIAHACCNNSFIYNKEINSDLQIPSIADHEKAALHCKLKHASNDFCHVPQKKTNMLSVEVCDNSNSLSDLATENTDCEMLSDDIFSCSVLVEMINLIDEISNDSQNSNEMLVPYFLRLKTLRESLEKKFIIELQNHVTHQNFLHEKYLSFFRNIVHQQTCLIDHLFNKIDLSIDESKRLYENTCNLRNLMRSYGFLKIFDEIKSDSTLSKKNIDSQSRSEKFSVSLASELVSTEGISKAIDLFKCSFSKLTDLSEKMNKLEVCLHSSNELNNNLISKVQAHGLHLKGVTKEIEEAQHLVSVLKEQHRKLQSTEGIRKYDLQEKRKLLTVLKQQLETTREDWNLVRLKNSKSEVEWKNLRKEFVQRHKQTSEESGFVDDKGLDEHNNIKASSLNDCNSVEENDHLPENNNLLDEPIKKSRLEILEEQSRLLYSNLLQGSKKRQEIDNRLEAMCKTLEKYGKTSNSEFSSNLNHCENSVEEMSEDNDSNNFANSPDFSSNVGSLNSDCSSYSAHASNSVEEENNCYCVSTNTLNSSLDCNLLSCGGKCDPSEKVLVFNSANDSQMCLSNKQKYIPLSKTVSESDLLSNLQSCSLQNLSFTEVDSLIIQKKDLEESLIEFASNNNSMLSETVDFKERASIVEQEKRILQQNVQDLEKKLLIVSTELDQTSQQLLLSKASKEHEVAALQFQLNTEALKYERALKEFSEQNTGLENMKQKVSDQEQLILALEEALAEIRTERENENEHKWQELQDLQVSLESREEECTALCEDLEKSISNIEEERLKNDHLLAKLEELKVYSERNKSNLESELFHLQNDSKQLKKRLVKLLKEKDLLWKQNDHLVYLQKTKIADRWMSDREVDSCLGCKSSFSFMLRKHHCRNCGQIFCYSCSNNWLLTASSRKHVRVCNECYKHYLELKKDARKGSDVPQVEDESEDDAAHDVFFNPVSSSSFSCDVPSSISDSMLSLPIKAPVHSNKIPIFASVPDLHFLEHDVTTLNKRSTTNMLRRKNYLETNRKNLSESPKINSTQDDDISDELNDDTYDVNMTLVEASVNGFCGNLVVDQEDQQFLNLICERSPIELQWSFTFIPEVVPVTISLKNEDFPEENTIYYQSEHKMNDKIILPCIGKYTIYFDNRLRKTDLIVNYRFTAKYISSSS